MIRLLAAVTLLFMLVLTACGSGASNSTTPASGLNAGNSSVQNSEPVEQQETIEVEHLLDTTTVEKKPKTVAVFDFGVLDTLDKLGIEVAAVPRSSLPPYLKKYDDDRYVNLGTLKEPDFESIHRLQPDLIIISGRQMELYDQFKEIAPTIYMGIDTANYMESFTENIKLLGEIFDVADEVELELSAIEQSIAELQEEAAKADKTGLVVLVTGGKVSAYGPGSRFGLIHDEFGIRPIDTNLDVSTHGQSISFEYIVEKDPDYLFVIDRDVVVSSGDSQAAASQVLENDLIKRTKAYREDNIVYLDPGYWYLSGGGLVSVQHMVQEVAEGIR